MSELPYGITKVPTKAMTSLGMMGKLGGAAGAAGGALSAASSVLGPVAIGLQVGNMLYGAWNAGKQSRKQIKALNKKAGSIRDNMVRNSSNLRENLTDIDEEFQDKQALLGENIGEKLEDASGAIGQTIQRGRGLLTGAADLQKQEIINDTGSYAQNQMEMLNTQRGQQYSGLMDAHSRQMSQSQQSLLDIASQQKDLRRKDSMWENLF